jgi:alpha-beta hydrolase superfamily lysophospholipase
MDRRQFLSGGALLSGAAATGWFLGHQGTNDALQQARFHPDNMLGQGDAAEVWYRHRFIDQPVMDAQLVFWLGLASAGLTDIGEVLDTATRIRPGDEDSWFDAWMETAERVEQDGLRSLKAQHRLSAANAFRRAGAYYRAGLMRYAKHSDPRLIVATKRGLALHDQALKLTGYDSHEIQIPYENSVLFGRIHYAPNVGVAPTIIVHQGLHAWPEDTMWVIDGALTRGYHVLSFHGPGQGASLRLHQHVFRPDWEVPVGAVLDFAQKDPRINRERMILMGLSFGGYLSGRAAAHESRLHALIVNPGVVSWADAMLRHYQAIPGIMPLHAKGPAAFDLAIDAASVALPDARWYFDDVSWKHGVDSPHALVEDLKRYDNQQGVSKIRCKTLIMDGTAEDATPGESQRFYDLLKCPKKLMTFDSTTASQMHCQGGNQMLAQSWLFDWLDEEIRP